MFFPQEIHDHQLSFISIQASTVQQQVAKQSVSQLATLACV
jgi:hypothetical protein